MKLINTLDIAIIREWFCYDRETGKLSWKQKPSNCIHVGSEAGRKFKSHKTYYRILKFQGKFYLSHILIWILLYGSIPEEYEIDHIDHNGLNNLSDNLRLVSCLENSHNKSLYKTNLSGVAGVSWSEPRKKWAVYISVNCKRKHLGYFSFDKKEDAIKIRKEAEIKYKFHENHGTNTGGG